MTAAERRQLKEDLRRCRETLEDNRAALRALIRIEEMKDRRLRRKASREAARP